MAYIQLRNDALLTRVAAAGALAGAGCRRARIGELNGEMAAIHRTFLRRDGTAKADVEPAKADVEPAKANLGPVQGGAIHLDPIAAEMVIGEGLETSTAAGRLPGLRRSAAISAGNLAKSLILMQAIRRLTVAVDRDPAGERAGREAAWRCLREGRRLRLMMPDRPGQGAADVLEEAARLVGLHQSQDTIRRLFAIASEGNPSARAVALAAISGEVRQVVGPL